MAEKYEEIPGGYESKRIILRPILKNDNEDDKRAFKRKKAYVKWIFEKIDEPLQKEESPLITT